MSFYRVATPTNEDSERDVEIARLTQEINDLEEQKESELRNVALTRKLGLLPDRKQRDYVLLCDLLRKAEQRLEDYVSKK